jgi:hypothetical protein
MNPRSIGNFLKSKFGLFVIFVVVLFSGLWIYGQHQATEREATKLAAEKTKKIELGQVKLPLDKGLEAGLPQQAYTPVVTHNESDAGGVIVPFRPPPPLVVAPPSPISAKTDIVTKPAPKPRKIHYASLLAGYEVPAAKTERTEPRAPDRFIPFGTLLKCKLVNTIDSANLDTPLIAVLLEDVWQSGKRVILANTLVHGTAHAGRIRDRITAAGAWRFVWQDGRELVFTGVALDREYDQEIDGYGITDGSAGLRGRVMATDDLQELKMLASAALSGFARGTQDRTQTAIGTTIVGSVSNGVREGVGNVFDLYAARTLKDIEDNGYFVRVAAGKEFYVYVLETVDPQKATLAGMNSHLTNAAIPETGAAPPQTQIKG